MPNTPKGPGAPGRSHRLMIGVVGPSTCDDAQAALARAVGQGIAEKGAALLCNGGGGIAGAAAAAAKAAGGLTVGLLPGASAAESPPGPAIELALFSDLGAGCAAVAASAADALVAIGGGFATLAEIGLFLRAKKPVVLLASWRFAIEDIHPAVPRAETAAEALDLLWAALGRAT